LDDADLKVILTRPDDRVRRYEDQASLSALTPLATLGSSAGLSSAQVFPLRPVVVRVIWPLAGVFIGGRTPDRERRRPRQ
jgi:hypothetical protein